MEKFYYKARNFKGGLVHGELEASNPKAAKQILTNQHLIPLTVSAKPAGLDRLKSIKNNIVKRFNKIPLEDLLMFNRQFQIVYSVGIPILTGLKFIEDQVENKTLKNAIVKIRADLSEGSTLSNAVSKHPDIFDRVYTQLIHAGEISGQLDVLLERVSYLTEQKNENRAKVRSALFYPKMVFAVIAVVFFVVIYFVLPKLKLFYTGFGAELPAITRFVMGISDFFNNYWYLVAAIAFSLGYGFKKFSGSEHGRQYIDRLVLKIPVMGKLITQIEMNTFCIVLELLLKSGIPIIEALEVVMGSLTNSVIIGEVKTCAEVVRGGGTLSQGFSTSKIFPKILVSTLALGEQAGEITKVLNKVGAYYRVEIDYRLNNLSKLIEPLLLLVIFTMVLVLALAVFMPMWKMSSVLKK